MVRATMCEDWDTLENLIPEKVHIGKFSAGWMFCFNANRNEYYYKNKLGIENFMATGRLQDEYGENMTNAEFWDKVAGFQDGMWEGTAESQMWPHPEGEKEEIIDGLRWSAWDDFS